MKPRKGEEPPYTSHLVPCTHPRCTPPPCIIYFLFRVVVVGGGGEGVRGGEKKRLHHKRGETYSLRPYPTDPYAQHSPELNPAPHQDRLFFKGNKSCGDSSKEDRAEGEWVKLKGSVRGSDGESRRVLGSCIRRRIGRWVRNLRKLGRSSSPFHTCALLRSIRQKGEEPPSTTHTHTHTHTHKHTHARMHARTHAHTHTHLIT